VLLLLLDGLNSTRREDTTGRECCGGWKRARFQIDLRSIIFSPVFVRIASTVHYLADCFARLPLCCTGAAA